MLYLSRSEEKPQSFSSGREAVDDDYRSGAPVTVIMLFNGFGLLHDIARPHKTKLIKAKIVEMHVVELEYPPHNPAAVFTKRT